MTNDLQTILAPRPTVEAALPLPERPIIPVTIFDTANVGASILSCLKSHGDFQLIGGTCEAPPFAKHQPHVALLFDPALAGRTDDTILRQVLAELESRLISVAVVTDRPARFNLSAPCCVALSPDDSAEIIGGVIRGLAAASQTIARLREDRRRMQHVGESVHAYFSAMDCELRLASRLQREFMPPSGQRFGPLLFNTLFRPSNWVSGDVFDILRLDEDHVAFYLADAMGHGVAAGLLTMYVRQAIRPKRFLLSGYELIPPGEVLGLLNDRFCEQKLLEPHFISAIYGVVNFETLQMDYAVAGHPPVLRIKADSAVTELPGEGSLLGLTLGQTFDTQTTQLYRGDRILLYSDGLEPAIIAERRPSPQPPLWTDAAAEMLSLPADQLIPRLFDTVDRTPGSLWHADDVSAVVLDIDA